jgi:hypothetical protein
VILMKNLVILLQRALVLLIDIYMKATQSSFVTMNLL